MTHCLVIGGAGFIGSHLVEALVARGHRVRVLDNFSTGNMTNLAAVMKDIELFVGDLADAELVNEAVKGIDVVFHQASPCNCTHDSAEVHKLAQVGTMNTRNVLVASHHAGVRLVVYASSAQVYGSPFARWANEENLPNPSSLQAAGHLASEEECKTFTRLYGLKTVRLRYFNVFGPRQSNFNSSPNILQILKAMLFGRRPVVNGDGLAWQDFIYVDDVVYANLLVAEARRVSGKVYNIGCGRPTTLLDVIAVFNALLGTHLQPLYGDARPWIDLQNLADTFRSEAELGFCPATDLETGLRLWIDSCVRRQQDLLAPATWHRSLGRSPLRRYSPAEEPLGQEIPLSGGADG
ncbi:MAG TPA: NAD-dependent epimerase/dehydratase family protein [Gemmataceae bacterium]|nr:NAD-dependent epimerase/dehydratase family protein [Gemmataceae bacterium]